MSSFPSYQLPPTAAPFDTRPQYAAPATAAPYRQPEPLDLETPGGWRGAQPGYDPSRGALFRAPGSGTRPRPPRSLDYGDPGIVESELPPPNRGLPYRQGPGFLPPGDASPHAYRPNISAFKPVSALLGVIRRADRMVTIAVPRAAFQYPPGSSSGLPAMPSPVMRAHYGYVTHWPQTQPLFRVMGPNG